jgi:ribonuclease PH
MITSIHPTSNVQVYRFRGLELKPPWRDAPLQSTHMIYRSDNRGPDQMRPVKITPGYIVTAEGSVLIEIGNTRVICTASIEESVPAFMRNRGRGWVTAEYSMLPRSTLTRTPREVSKGRIGGRTHEIQRLIGRSLRAVTDLERLGERSILVDCDVIQADGGTRTASITGAFVALGLALEKLIEAGTLTSVPLRDFVGAISVGIVDGEILLDLNYEEDSRADVDMNFVMTAGRKLVEVQATSEHQVFDEEQLKKMIAVASAGVQALIAKQQAVLGGLTLRQ